MRSRSGKIATFLAQSSSLLCKDLCQLRKNIANVRALNLCQRSTRAFLSVTQDMEAWCSEMARKKDDLQPP